MMKRLFILILLGFMSAAVADAYSRNTYFNVGLTGTNMAQTDFPELKSNFGLNMNIGQTLPITRGGFQLGLDLTWLDLNYTNYKIKHVTAASTENYKYNQFDLAVQIGPSIAVMFGEWMRLHGYFRYAPTYSILKKPEAGYGNYATNFVTGASLTFGAIGLGAEYRFGGCRYKQFGPHRAGPKTDLTGLRAYLAFRF